MQKEKLQKTNTKPTSNKNKFGLKYDPETKKFLDEFAKSLVESLNKESK